jgi:predicted MFS family arabinose efflux permease
VCAYAFLGDLVLLYPVYALLFSESGLSTAEISSLFILWSVTGLALEVPSGALADATSRRALLVVAPLLAGAAFALWVTVPAYWAFALGFVLWGAHGALQSGAYEALVYEELDRLGAADAFPALLGRATAAATAAVAVATAVAAPVLALGGFAALGVASVLACVAAAAVAATLPEHRAGHLPALDEDPAQPARALATGLREVRTSRAVRTAVLLVAAVTAIWGALDEYTGLLAAEAGASTAAVPLLVLVVYVGMTLGGLAAGAVGGWSPRGRAWLMAAAAVALAAGALSASPAGFVLLALAFGALQALTVVADARLQDAIDGPARATVTSVAGFATEILTVGVFLGYGAGSAALGDAQLFAAFAVVYLAIALGLLRAARRR